MSFYSWKTIQLSNCMKEEVTTWQIIFPNISMKCIQSDSILKTIEREKHKPVCCLPWDFSWKLPEVCSNNQENCTTKLHPWKLRWHWKIARFNRKYIFLHGGFSIVLVFWGIIHSITSNKLQKLSLHTQDTVHPPPFGSWICYHPTHADLYLANQVILGKSL